MVRDDRVRGGTVLIAVGRGRYLTVGQAEANPLAFLRCKTQSDYEAMILTPEQAFAILLELPEAERTLTLLAAGTRLRISECLGLQWQDVIFSDSLIQVRRTWTRGKAGRPKSKASQAPVPMHSLLADFVQAWKCETPYSQPGDWIFPSPNSKADNHG